MKVCVEAENKTLMPFEMSREHERKFLLTVAIDIKHFWQWRSFRSYVVFFVYTMSLYSLLYFTVNSWVLVEFTGMICQLCDGLVAAPQAWKNCVKQSVKNLR